jgi:hypothetical protein
MSHMRTVCEREGARHCGCTAGVREVSKCHLRVCNMWEEEEEEEDLFVFNVVQCC